MRVTEHLKRAKSTPVSFEVLPPLKGNGIESLYRVLDPLMRFDPPFINVTYHRSEYVYKKRKDGYLEKVAIRKRPGTVGICAAIMHKYEVDTVPHLICGGFSKLETENALIDLHYVGVDNVLLVRGDPAKHERTFTPHPEGHHYAIDLVRQVVDMNRGQYLEEELKDGFKTNFCIGAGGYPEKHFEAPNMETDLKHLKRKVEAGSDYITTQMFFDNKKFFEFVTKCRKAGIKVPIIPGIKPVTTPRHLRILPQIFNVDIPAPLVSMLEKCKTKEAVRKVGIKWTIEQCQELIEYGVPCLHFYTMSNSKPIQAITKELF